MAVSIASNNASISAQTTLAKTTKELGGVYERLSSGLRINKSSDDPAGAAVAESLLSNARVANVAIRNANDGISLTSIADSALGTIGDILNRLGELASQSANGVYTTTQRSALSSEFVALGSEIERIASTTSFNSINLLSNSSSVNIQVGLDSSSTSVISIGSVVGTLAALGIGNTSGVLTYSLNASSTAAAQSASSLALDAITSAISTLASTRGLIGASQSRLSVAVDNLTNQRDNFLSAASRIRDADVAAETAELVRLQVSQQAGTAILAQANQQPARALALLQ